MSKKVTSKNIKSGVEDDKEGKYILQLYITSASANCAYATMNIHSICEKYLQGRYELEIIDINKNPEMATANEIVAIPVLIKKFPFPEVRMIGDLSDVDMVLKGLRII